MHICIDPGILPRWFSSWVSSGFPDVPFLSPQIWWTLSVSPGPAGTYPSASPAPPSLLRAAPVEKKTKQAMLHFFFQAKYHTNLMRHSTSASTHLQSFALLLSLNEPGLRGLHLLPVPFTLLLPALLFLTVLRLELVKTGQFFSLQRQRPLLLLLQEHVPTVAARKGSSLVQRGSLEFNLTVLLWNDSLVKGKTLGF